ncbi:hypothetical protein FLK61_40525 [Paenalkalicoccus suaedae]|uniref:Uncharacterized protein n=1 Tax=Paenalkalicoccus suaedae TaxID=2592382 RepID=A0A859FIA4_9BACI|nr:hypothetical protein [Paenalkalicoccus suaedae]QKS72887.1 hypothetical protein FLK61_40525 [Paenalkalicoccus suaedae]
MMQTSLHLTQSRIKEPHYDGQSDEAFVQYMENEQEIHTIDSVTNQFPSNKYLYSSNK